MRAILLAGLILGGIPQATESMGLLPLHLGHDYTQADVRYVDQCIVATANGFAMENPQLGLGWAPVDTAKGMAEDYLFRYGSRTQACMHATQDLEKSILQAEDQENG